MSLGIRIEDIAWQAYQAAVSRAGNEVDLALDRLRYQPAGMSNPNRLTASMLLTDDGFAIVNAEFMKWWNERIAQGAALPECQQCGFDPGLKVTHVWISEIERDPPSLNARIFNSGPRKYLYKKERDAWHWAMKSERLRLHIPKALQKRRVTLTRVYAGRQKERDADNLAGGMKACVDAIVLEGLLVNDTPQYAEIHYQQERVSSWSPKAHGARRTHDGSFVGLRIKLEEFSPR